MQYELPGRKGLAIAHVTLTLSAGGTTFSPMTRSAISTAALVGALALTVARTPAAAQQRRLGAEWNEFAPQYRSQIDRWVTVGVPNTDDDAVDDVAVTNRDDE
jgi:hypothetical protein